MDTNKKWIIIAVVVLLIIALGYIFSPSDKIAEEMAENYMEKTLEQQGGGDVDINVDDGSFKMETEDGTIETGGDVALPDNFPSDVYVYEGKLLTVMQLASNNTLVSIETKDSPAEVKDAYVEKMEADGWTQTGLMDFGTTVSILGEKGTRTLSVTIGKEEGEMTTIALNLSEK